jgi:hypothetical protein
MELRYLTSDLLARQQSTCIVVLRLLWRVVCEKHQYGMHCSEQCAMAFQSDESSTESGKFFVPGRALPDAGQWISIPGCPGNSGTGGNAADKRLVAVADEICKSLYRV